MIINPINLRVNKDNKQHFRSKTTENKPGFQKCLSIKQDTLSFTGLSKQLHQNVFLKESQIAEFVETNPQSNGLIANLPPNWINKIQKKDRPKLIKEVYSSFAEATMLLRKAHKDITIDETATEASNIIKNALVHSGIITNDEKFSLKELGSGRYGSAYHFKVGNEPFILKVYHDNNCGAGDMDGMFVEINRAAFIMKNLKKSDFVQFYFGDLKTGYMVCRYQDGNSDKIFLTDKAYQGYEYEDDKDTNVKGGKVIDFGGIEIKDPLLLQNKRARNIIEKIYQTPDNNRFKAWNYFYNLNSSVAKKQDILLGLAFSIKYLTQNKLEALNIIAKDADNNIKKVIIRQIKDFPKENIFEALKILAPDSDNDIKAMIIWQLEGLPKENMLEAFKILAKDANNDIKDMLAVRMKYLPEENRVEVLEILVKDANEGIKKELTRQIEYLPQGNRLEAFKIIGQDATENIKKELTRQIKYLSEENRLEAFEILEKGATKDIKKLLAWTIECLPDKNKLQSFEMLANDATGDIEKVLTRQIQYLPQGNRVAALNMLSGTSGGYSPALAATAM